MYIIEEIAQAIDDYTYKHDIMPNKIYIAHKTFFDVIKETSEYVVVHDKKDEYHGLTHTICGMEVDLSRHIKDGFVVVHEWM